MKRKLLYAFIAIITINESRGKVSGWQSVSGMAADAAAISIDVSSIISTNAFSPMGTVKNNSIDAESFSATLTAPGYSSTINVLNLASGATQQITFDPWTPSAGTHTLTLSVSLAGDLDVTNDTLTKDIAAYDPFENYGWTVRPDAPIASYDAATAAISFSNGTSYVFLLGGFNGTNFLTDHYSFNALSNSWTIQSSFSTPTFTANAAVIGERIYYISGYNYTYTGDNQIYDIGSETWTFGSSIPTPVGDYAFGVYKDSLLYYFGGLDFYAGNVVDLVQIYDPVTDSWTNGTPLPAVGRGWQGGISGNKIIVSGGVDNYSELTAAAFVGTIDLNDPSIISWIQVDDYPTGAVFRGGSGATLDPSSGLIVFTGGEPTVDASVALSATFAFDLNSNTWKIGPDKPTAANNLRNMSCAVYNDSMYVVSVGGWNGAFTQANEWLNMGPSPLATSVAGHFQDVNLNVFPNPFTQFILLTFKMEHTAPVKISITDVTGKEVAVLCDNTLAAGDQQITWNACAYSAGVYFCNVNVEGAVDSQKLVKLK